MAQKLRRTTFVTSRALDFFKERQLTTLMGDDQSKWPLIITKELIDNSLDACEDAGIAPEIAVEIEKDAIIVRDNGPGIPEHVLQKSLDYLVRVSDKAYYVSPTRGQLGNALKVVWAAPFVMRGKSRIEVLTPDYGCAIDVTVNRIKQEPVIGMNPTTTDVKNGTSVEIGLPGIASYLSGWKTGDSYTEGAFAKLILSYAMFNPHATFSLDDSCMLEGLRFESSDVAWKKWKPSDAIPAHWYTAKTLRDLVAAYLSDDKKRTLRQFVGEFRGLAGSMKQKRVTEAIGLTGAPLTGLVNGGDVDKELIERLLTAMKEETKPVNPRLLGVIGKEYLSTFLVERCNVHPESIRYSKQTGESDGLPFVVESVFGVYTEERSEDNRLFVCGLNWAPSLSIPIPEIERELSFMKMNSTDPVVLAVHIAYPHLQFSDPAKARLNV